MAREHGLQGTQDQGLPGTEASRMNMLSAGDEIPAQQPRENSG